MKSLKDLTVIIVTYNTSQKVILDCLDSISKDVNILIVENSSSFINENLVITKFPNVNIICTGENLGYGKGNNFGINHVKTDYVLILNPDVTCDNKFFSNILFCSRLSLRAERNLLVNGVSYRSILTCCES